MLNCLLSSSRILLCRIVVFVDPRAKYLLAFYMTNFSDKRNLSSEAGENSLQYITETEDILLVISTSICIFGTISNVISLSYFLSNWSNKLGVKLLVLLNTLDFLVSSTGTVFLAFRYFSIHHLVIEVVEVAYFVFLECSASVTLLLAVARFLSLYFPFYEVKTRNIAFSLGTFCLYSVVKGGVFLLYRTTAGKESEIWRSSLRVHNIMIVAFLFLIITVVLAVNLLTIRKLIFSANEMTSSAAQPPSTQTNKHATITILILSGLFCFFNLLYSAVLCSSIRGTKKLISFNPSLLYAVIYTAIPVNSALNPVIYFCRKREMRNFLLRKICCTAITDQRESYTLEVVTNAAARQMTMRSIVLPEARRNDVVDIGQSLGISED